MIGFVEAIDQLDPGRRDDVYWSGRATLLADPEDIATYDSAFAVFWEGRGIESIDHVDLARQVTIAIDEGVTDGEAQLDPLGGPTVHVRYSATEVLGHLDFAECTEDELDQLHQMMAELPFTADQRPSRRLESARRGGTHPDLRRTIRRAMTTGGEPIRIERRTRRAKPRRLVLLVDVSGSMESYARALLRFAHAAVVGRTRVEAFTIGTRLTRVTRELSSRDPDAAMRAAGESVRDFSGGTRLGATLREFNDDWGVRGVARGAVVVVLSDGWDRGEPELLAEEMARLHRVTHRLVWVNPLKHTPGYAPLARGMAAALPHVDEFVEGHAFVSLERLVRLISR